MKTPPLQYTAGHYSVQSIIHCLLSSSVDPHCPLDRYYLPSGWTRSPGDRQRGLLLRCRQGTDTAMRASLEFQVA